ncbi:MAG: HAMP domain-containing histidine kinase [Cytophagales bacterium]|nr:HAMP domain-containing histidine kinase [Cytophagales bacterium]
MTIRTRLTIRFTLLVGAILLAFSGAIYSLYAFYRSDEFYGRLQEQAFTTAKLLTGVNGIDPAFLREMDRNQLTSLFAEEVTIYNQANRIIYDSGNEPFPVSKALLAQVRKGQWLRLRNGRVEVVAIPYRQAGTSLVVVVSAMDLYGFTKLDRLRNILGAGWIVSVVVTILAGRYFAGRALQPVSHIVQQVNGISASNIHARLQTGKSQDELVQLSQTFNKMLSRLEEAFTLQKSFVSHASHELRTPLAVITSQIEVTRMQARTPAAYQEVLDSVLEEVRHMNHLTDNLLALARVSADAATVPTRPLRVDELLWQAEADLLRKNSGYAIEILYAQLPDREEQLVVRGNEPLLRTAFLNLMENGCKYSADHAVRVNLFLHPAALEVRVVDKGTGIAPEDLPHVFEPFYRSEQNGNVAGYGIGLPLTYRIVKLHGGSICLDSLPGQGTTVIVVLPLLESSLAGIQAVR